MVEVRGRRFLAKMIRKIVHAIASVGRGALPLATVRMLLAGACTPPTRPTGLDSAPAAGLRLEWIRYD